MKAKNILSLFAALSIILLSGCESPMKVDSESDPNVDLTAYQTYSLLPLPDSIPGADPGAVLRMKRIVTDALKEAMADKGYTEVALQVADFAVHITGKVVPKTDVTDWGYAYSPSPRWGYRYPYHGGGSNVTVDQYEEGSLILEIFDTTRNEMVWVGWGTARTKGKDPTPERALSVVSEILASFPSTPEASAAAAAASAN